MRIVLAVLIALILALPAWAKPKPDVYPVSCDVLWTAIKSTLQNPQDYGVLYLNDLSENASFVIVGNLVRYTQHVSLTEQGDGCKMKLAMLQVGADNTDERAFLKRVKKSLIKLQSTKPVIHEETEGAGKPSTATGQQ